MSKYIAVKIENEEILQIFSVLKISLCTMSFDVMKDNFIVFDIDNRDFVVVNDYGMRSRFPDVTAVNAIKLLTVSQ